jgi:hypothetical protein
MIIGVFDERLSASYMPALAVSWAMFLLPEQLCTECIRDALGNNRAFCLAVT